MHAGTERRGATLTDWTVEESAVPWRTVCRCCSLETKKLLFSCASAALYRVLFAENNAFVRHTLLQLEDETKK
ncbi:hypothetical protein MRX96_018920 [Rhipicephalus microplus]